MSSRDESSGRRRLCCLVCGTMNRLSATCCKEWREWKNQLCIKPFWKKGDKQVEKKAGKQVEKKAGKQVEKKADK